MEINVDEYKYIAVIDDGATVLVENKETKNIIGIPMTPEVTEAFQIHYNEENSELPASPSLLTISTVNNKSWCDKATRLLIYNYKKHEKLFRDNTIKNETVWKQISEMLQKDNFNFTTTQIINKWKHLKKMYMKQKDNMGKKSSGEANFTFKYYEAMDEIFHKNSNVEPIAIASSSKGSQINSDILNKSFESTPDENNKKRKIEFENTSTPRKSKHKNEIISWLEQRDQDRERRHKENMELQREAMNDFKTIMTNFLNKF